MEKNSYSNIKFSILLYFLSILLIHFSFQTGILNQKLKTKENPYTKSSSTFLDKIKKVSNLRHDEEVSSSLNKVTETKIIDNPNVDQRSTKENLNLKTKKGTDACNDKNCISPNGKCSDSKCICSDEYYEFSNLDKTLIEMNELNENLQEELFCQYKKKDHRIAIIYELLFPLGVGHFYSKRYIVGVFKFTWFVFFPIFFLSLIACFKAPNKNEEAKSGICHKILLYLYFLICVCWYVIDIVFFSIGKYSDGNGVELY